MTSSRTWGGFFDPYCGGGARWRPFRFRSPSWMTSFAESEMKSSKMATGSGRAAILRRRRNGGRKNRPILLTPTMFIVLGQYSRIWNLFCINMHCPSGPHAIQRIEKLLNCQTTWWVPLGWSRWGATKTALWLWVREMTWYLDTRGVRGRMKAK